MTRGLLLVGVLGALVGCRHDEAKPDPAPTPDPAPHQEARPHSHVALLAGVLLPPADPHGFRSAVSGCAAETQKDTEPTRGLPPEEKVVATAVPTGLVLTHEVPHACCLSEKTEVKVEGQAVTITEHLEGTPCRCLCGSTVRTAVALEKGTWQVEVITQTPGATRSAWRGPVEVK